MVDLDRRAAVFREEMVDSLRRLGVVDETVLVTMASVPRHRFVDRFWAVTPGSRWTRQNVREFVMTGNCSDEILRLVYDPFEPVATRGPIDQPVATSALSAPVIVGLMLTEMTLSPGLHVLEIGTGSGYNAALISELVGGPTLVTTVDIDPTLIAQAIPRLDRLGYGGIGVRTGDGADGVPDRAPFDRVVATVGCLDIAPAWVDQLVDDGELLVPLEHGAMHPRVLVKRSETGLDGRFVGRSGFVRIQGSQARHRVWAGEALAPNQLRREPLPASLVDAFAPPDPHRPRRTPGLWDFATYLGIRDARAGIRDRRAAWGPGLSDSTSVAMIQGDKLGVTGPGGRQLADRLLAVAHNWVELGCPGQDSYTITFAPRDQSPVPPDTPGGPWALDRIDYRQHISLTPWRRSV